MNDYPKIKIRRKENGLTQTGLAFFFKRIAQALSKPAKKTPLGAIHAKYF